MRFRPLPGATIAVLIALPILIGLGLWQLQRLHWKEALLAEIDAHIHAPPISFAEAQHLGPAAQYRRVILNGAFLSDRSSYIYTTGNSGGPAMHLVTPLRMDGGGILMVDQGLVPVVGQKPAPGFAAAPGHHRVLGVWRTPDPPGLFTPKPDLADAIWYSRDVVGMARLHHLSLAVPVIVEADATANPGGWPRGGQTVVDIPNNHLSYALTWFGLAATLAGIYLAYHVAQGRLSFGRAA